MILFLVQSPRSKGLHVRVQCCFIDVRQRPYELSCFIDVRQRPYELSCFIDVHRDRTDYRALLTIIRQPYGLLRTAGSPGLRPRRRLSGTQLLSCERTTFFLLLLSSFFFHGALLTSTETVWLVRDGNGLHDAKPVYKV